MSSLIFFLSSSRFSLSSSLFFFFYYSVNFYVSAFNYFLDFVVANFILSTLS